MNFDRKAPCSDCPFLKEGGIRLRASRIEEIARPFLQTGRPGGFTCHKTVRARRRRQEESHCVGALLFAEKHGHQTQYMQICERIGFYNPKSLRGRARVFDSLQDWLTTAL